MKRFLGIMLSAVLAMGCLSACGTTSGQGEANTLGARESADTAESDKISIVTTIFPEYDWVKQILGENAENAELTLLLDNGVDLHSYQPTAEDILKISGCDMFVYVGGESDEWVEDVLESAENKDMEVIDLLEVVGDELKEEEVKEGMQAEEEHEEEHEEGEEETEYDEHVWLSVKNAKVICEKIADELGALDPENAESYKSNYEAYAQKLDALDKDFTELAENTQNKTLVFGDRFPFRYFVDDYGLDYYAAFVGCSAETEASFETVVFLAKKMDELGSDTIYTIENSDRKIAQAVINSSQNKERSIAALDSMQSAGEDADYISIMQSNYEV
ncbi:MAG: zinc ABC transporter substrate-binding protein, partial [Firmicutes bacterium]|nr:zinc ABC transporter substrate-binding protein [Bacillota bacterium]